ncbi:MAG: DCC1-like thiol-disulfide oxidoreductase family protein [Bryobacteraceae bacterium]
MIHTLTVIYDPRCGLCTQIKGWLAGQPACVTLRLLAAGSAEARERFPMIPAGELAVVSDSGQVWRGDNAWIVCLWALCEYRQWAAKLASPLLRPLARQAFSAVSQRRSALSRFLGLRSEADLRRQLSEVTLPPCQIL